MKLIKITKTLKILTDLRFAIFLLTLISLSSGIGSIIEQDETLSFYAEKYPIEKPIYGFINSKIILNLGLDHIFRAYWFLGLLALFGLCLISCTITQQLPNLLSSKKYFFKQKTKAFIKLPLFIKLPKHSFSNEKIILEVKKNHWSIYQKKKYLYAYKGLLGRISPIVVHISLIILLVGSAAGAFLSFKAQEMTLKGEFLHIQNPIRVGSWAKISVQNYRINDFWLEYKNQKISQFFTNISILDNFGNEAKYQTISVNHPIRNQGTDLYQSDWSLIGVRAKLLKLNKSIEFPLFPLKNQEKSWVTCLQIQKNIYILIFNQLQNIFLLYDQKGQFLSIKNIGDLINNDLLLQEILPSTGLLFKYDPTVSIMYLGFGLLMLTASLSYLPYLQLWVCSKNNLIFIGTTTNRGKAKTEIEFKTLIKFIKLKVKAFIIKSPKDRIMN